MEDLKSMQVSEVVEKLFVIEKQLNLFEQQIQGVYFWKLVRFEIFMLLTQQAGVYEQAHTKEYDSILEKIKAVVPKIKNTYLHSVFARSSQVDVLVIEHGRKVLIDNEYVDIYTEHKIKELDKSDVNYEIVDRPYLGKHFHKPSKNRSYFESITLTYLIQKFFQKIALTFDEQKLIENVQDKLFEDFGFKKNLNVLISNRIKLFKLKKKQYKKMLAKRKVKQVFIVVSYIHEPLISACQELGVECIELQHGTMHRYHVGYSFPYNNKVPYFPDKMELFGKYWQDSTPLPLEPEDSSIAGYPYLNKMFEKYQDIKKVKNRVVFISQGTIATEMTKMAFELAKENSGLEVFYKLHPGEFDRWRKEYPYLNDGLKFENLHVIENEIPLYELMASSEFLVGVYSTAIFEGLTLQCKTILLDLPGVEFMNYLIESKSAKLAQGVDDIIKLMQENDFVKIDRDYFFKET